MMAYGLVSGVLDRLWWSSTFLVDLLQHATLFKKIYVFEHSALTPSRVFHGLVDNRHNVPDLWLAYHISS